MELMNKDVPTVIRRDPAKPWWPGDPRVEPFMPLVRQAIARHIQWPSEEFTDIYNRAYEAVYAAIVEYAGTEKPTHARRPRKRKK